MIQPDDLEFRFTPSSLPSPSAARSSSSASGAMSGASERDHIVAVLAACGGNQTRAAEVLGIARRTLIARLDKYGIARPQKRTTRRVAVTGS